MSRKRKSIQTITDPLLEPFFISKDEFCYTVKQSISSDVNHRRSNGEVKIYEKNLSYFADFGEALSQIAKLKSGSEDFNSLKEYINHYKIISNQIKNYTDGIRSIV